MRVVAAVNVLSACDLLIFLNNLQISDGVLFSVFAG